MNYDAAKERLESFRKLEHGWDSYGAVPIDPRAIIAAVELLVDLGGGWTPVPCSDGSVQLEKVVNSCEVEILIQGWDH